MNHNQQDAPYTATSAHQGEEPSMIDSAVENVTAKAKGIRSSIAEGTENFSEEARERVIAARKAALSASDSTREMAKEGAKTAQDFFENQPLVVGALAVAFGAALGSLLPRNRLEDEYLGSHRDELVKNAERIFDEERRKLETVTGAALDEARNILDDKKRAVGKVTGDQTVVGAVIDEVRRAGQQVADKAVEVADRENLGKPTI
jgi:ElaB/YqjD/DUF883 family membrane-anchored ribosome-binding protein